MDWHGVRTLNHTAVVTCEQRPRLMAFDLTSTIRSETPLHPRWGMENVGPLESEVNSTNNFSLDRQWRNTYTGEQTPRRKMEALQRG